MLALTAALHRDALIINLETVLRGRDNHLRNLGGGIKDWDTHIINLETVIKEKDAILNGISNSGGLKALLIFYRIGERIFPANRRGRLFFKINFNTINNLRCIGKSLIRRP